MAKAKVSQTLAEVNNERLDTAEAQADTDRTNQHEVNVSATALVEELISKIDEMEEDAARTAKGFGAWIAKVDWQRRRNSILVGTAIMVGLIAIVVGVVVGTVYFKDRGQGRRDQRAQQEFRQEQSRQGKILESQNDIIISQARTIKEQSIRLASALDPNGCAAKRGQAGTALLILDLKNTIHIDNGHPEMVQKPPQALVDASKQVCPGDPGGPPIVDEQGNPIPQDSTPSPPVEEKSAEPPATSTGSQNVAPPTTVPSAPAVPPPPSPTNPVQIPLPEPLPKPPPIEVPTPQTLIDTLTKPLCQLKLLCPRSE